MDAEELFRGRGFIPSPGRASIDLSYDEFPICFARAFDLRKECGATQPSHDKRAEVVNKPRECPKFTPRVQGFTSKEHQEMIISEKILEMQRQRENADREWQHKESDLQRTWQAER